MPTARSLDTSPGARVRLTPASMQYAARLDAAETAVARHDYAGAQRVLDRAPSLLQGVGDGRILELMALCALHGPPDAAQDPAPLITRALWAYQEAHDVAGMQRCHGALGAMACARGELALAARELGYAQRLLERQKRPLDQVLGLCAQAEVALARGTHAHEALVWAHEAVATAATSLGAGSQPDPQGAQAQARLVRAQALCMTGDAIEAARDLLWAQRLSNAVPEQHPRALVLALARARCLLYLGHPHRAATCLAQVASVAHACREAHRVAHYQLLQCEAWVGDQPHRAHEAGLSARKTFAGYRHTYHRVACDIALVRTALRIGAKDCRARLAALRALRLERWPLLEHASRQAAAEVEAPFHHPLGAVQTPWMHAVGHVDLAPKPGRRPATEPEAPAPGLMERLQHAWGRVGRDPQDSTQVGD